MGSVHNGTGLPDPRLSACRNTARGVSRVTSLYIYAHQAHQPRQGPKPVPWGDGTQHIHLRNDDDHRNTCFLRKKTLTL